MPRKTLRAMSEWGNSDCLETRMLMLDTNNLPHMAKILNVV